MEIGQHFVKAFRVEFGKKICKITESDRALVKMLGLFDHLIRNAVYIFINSVIAAL